MLRTVILLLAAASGSAFTPMRTAKLAAAPARSKVVVSGTFIEDFKFKRFFNRFTFKSLAAALEANDMAAELAKGDVTIFAPTDAAFEELGKEALAAVMADKAQLNTMLKYHMMAGKQMGPSFRLDNEKKLVTLEGRSLTVDSDGTTAYVNDAKIETYDVETDEGIFHIIDWVNFPAAEGGAAAPAAAAPAAAVPAAAAAPAASGGSSTHGKYDEMLWDINAKKDVFAAWDPAQPRSVNNFNPFERDETGNLADCSGYFPGGVRYKDPIRPDASFTIMQEEAKIMAEVATDAKFDTVGQPGNL